MMYRDNAAHCKAQKPALLLHEESSCVSQKAKLTLGRGTQSSWSPGFTLRTFCGFECMYYTYLSKAAAFGAFLLLYCRSFCKFVMCPSLYIPRHFPLKTWISRHKTVISGHCRNTRLSHSDSLEVLTSVHSPQTSPVNGLISLKDLGMLIYLLSRLRVRILHRAIFIVLKLTSLVLIFHVKSF